ncbi:MAG TPA: hypothetical protein DCY01_02520 [Ruminococcus sp.]|nr:hypothetical protein [Ruminococcus sp.]HBA01099.1 hypothetical protein [Ruminococcus sp.]
MKTKISHLGRSTVSVILAVMMLLSTMLIGTVSTVNAVQLTKGTELYLIGEMNGWKTSDDWKLTQKSGDSNYYSGKFIVDGSNGDISFKLLDKTNNKYYSKSNTSFSSNDTVCSGLSDDTSLPNMTIKPITSGKVTIDVIVYCEYSGDSRLEIKQTVSALPKVADSVTLTASPETVTSGGSTTLTATLTSKAEGVGNVTYTFKTADGTEVGTVTNFAENTASVDVANITSDTTYTVTVSADGYSDVTGSTTVAMPESTTLNFMVRSNDTDISKGVFKKIGDEYILDVTFDQTGDYSFYVKDDKGDNNPIYYRNQVGTLEDLTSNVTLYKYGSNNAGHYVTLSVATPGTYGIKMNARGENYSVSLYKIPDTSVTYTVNYGVNGDNGTLSATGVSGSGSTVNSGTKVTFTATPNKDYTVEGWYSDDKCTNKIDAAGTNKTYTVTVNADTNVYVKFRTANTYTVTFSSSDDKFGTVSAMKGTTSLTSPATVTEGDEVTFTATPKQGYAFESWTVSGSESASSTANLYKITVNKDTTVVANFKEMTGTLSDYYLLCGTDATFKPGSYTPVRLYKNEE